ncbi:MAG: histidinol dehydrogenase, partial [Clostridia bacterium]|nr:histidinol dehydrogenase [Clostridia bacterium]
MLQIVKTNGKTEFELLAQLEARAGETDRKVTAAVTAILETVREGGDKAVENYTKQFDGVDMPLREIGREELGELAKACDPAIYASLERAAASIADFHRRQVTQTWMNTLEDG